MSAETKQILPVDLRSFEENETLEEHVEHVLELVKTTIQHGRNFMVLVHQENARVVLTVVSTLSKFKFLRYQETCTQKIEDNKNTVLTSGSQTWFQRIRVSLACGSRRHRLEKRGRSVFLGERKFVGPAPLLPKQARAALRSC